jgi:hypothetical protein
MRAVDRLVLNASRVIGVLRDFSAPDPMDVTIDWLNDDGTLTSHTFANIAKSQIANDDHNNSTDNPHNVTKAQVGLGNVDNTSDADKPVSTATQDALNMKSDMGHNHDELYHPKEGDTNLDLNAKEILAVTGQNAVKLLQNEVRLYSKKDTDDEVHYLFNMYDNGSAFEQAMRDKDYNYVSNKIRTTTAHKAYVIDILGGSSTNQISIVDHNGRIINQNPTLGNVHEGNQRFRSIMNRTPFIDTYHDVYDIYKSGTTTDRALQIKFPEAMRDKYIMMKIKLEGFEYYSQSSWAATISGYNYGPNDRWYNQSVELSGNPPFKTVYLSHDTSDNKRRCIVLGETDTTWRYPTIKISAQISYSNRQDVDFATGWDHAFIENMDNINDDSHNKKIFFPLNAYARNLTLQNNWKNYGGSYESAKFSINHGVVNLMGLIKNGDGNSVIATLPEWATPSKRRIFNVRTNNGVGRLDVRGDGGMYIYGDNNWVSLDNVSFAMVHLR